jgi:hypothetical protein
MSNPFEDATHGSAGVAVFFCAFNETGKVITSPGWVATANAAAPDKRQ